MAIDRQLGLKGMQPENELWLKDRVAVVIGAGGAVGRSVVEHLAARGATLAGADLRLPKSHRMYGVEFDAADTATMRSFADGVNASLGRVDILVNCQGLLQLSPCDELTDEDWNAIINANLTSVFNSTRAFIPGLRRAKSGSSIVNIASTAGEYGSIRPSAHYAAAKGAVIAFSKSIARELAPAGIRVNVVSPGPLDTPMLGADTPEERQSVAERCPLGRLGTSDDVASAVLYLVSPGASWVTGHVLRVNGGSLI